MLLMDFSYYLWDQHKIRNKVPQSHQQYFVPSYCAFYMIKPV